MNVAIIANSGVTLSGCQVSEIRKADLVIAADGGANTCMNHGIEPAVLLGDLDSVSGTNLDRLTAAGVEIVRFPARKDATDLELALDLAIERGAGNICLYSVLGGRWDMSIANILVAAQPKYDRARVSLYGSDCLIRALKGGRKHSLENSVGNLVTLLPIGGDSTGVTLEGFEYALNDHTLKLGATTGVSNIVRSNPAHVHLKSGILLCIVQLNQE